MVFVRWWTMVPHTHHFKLDRDVDFGMQCNVQHVQLRIYFWTNAGRKRTQSKRMVTLLALQMLKCFAKKSSSHFIQLFFVLQVVFLDPFIVRIALIRTIG
jgi:hypothetical protein